MKRIISSFAIGLVFGIGILVSGMANPAKVLNFFDIAGTWDPSLAFVMGGALIVTAIGFRLVLSRSHPLLAGGFSLPTKRDIDIRLLGGAAIFGVGWGIAGFCPGGVVPALGLGRSEPTIFVAALVAGMLIVRLIESARTRTARRHRVLRPGDQHDQLCRQGSGSDACAVVDSVMDIDYAAGRITYDHADRDHRLHPGTA
jgi:uncharacterized membrane protein YedE/YeeE